MNLVEHYVIAVYSICPLPKEEWMNEDYVEVDITTDCYGHIKRQIDYFPLSDWENIKEIGYYLG